MKILPICVSFDAEDWNAGSLIGDYTFIKFHYHVFIRRTLQNAGKDFGPKKHFFQIVFLRFGNKFSGELVAAIVSEFEANERGTLNR